MTHYLEETLIFPNRAENPIKWIELYNNRPVYIEIGFGNGDFLRHLAQENPEPLHVGIEVSQRCIDKTARICRREGLKNIRLIFGDARFLLRECFPDGGVQGVYMNFPCPWPKQKHARRRVTTCAFVEVLGTVLAMDGFFELMTDERWYAEEVVQAMGNATFLEVSDFQVNPDRAVTTKYHQKWIALGKESFRVRVTKTAPHRIPRIVGGMDSMHVVVKDRFFDGKDLKRYQNREGGTENTHWVFTEAFVGADGSGLIKTITVDEGFEQRFFIALTNREEKCVVKVDPSSSPYRTPAVRMAIEEAAAVLKGEEGEGQ